MASSRISRLTAPPSSILLDDHRFRALLSDEDWGRLPLAIWRRFSKRFADGETVVYVGEVDEASFSRTRWWPGQRARPLRGAPSCGGPTHGPIGGTAAAGSDKPATRRAT